MSDVSASPDARFALLLDTNAFIALEPKSPSFQADLPDAADLVRLAQEGHHGFFLSAGTTRDIDRDPIAERRQANHLLASKYQHLDPIAPPNDLLAVLGELAPPPGRNTNDDVDLEMLSAVWVGAVDFLVTQDDRLRRRGVRAGLGDRILTILEAVAFLRRLTPRASTPPPAVVPLRTYNLDPRDPIFDSLREDYAGFDAWFTKTRRAPGRPSWIIEAEDGSYGALMIVKDEQPGESELPGKVLKLCTFKVAPHALGRAYGELLLKTLFGHLHHGDYDTVYVTTYPKQERLVELLEDFGFLQLGALDDERDELVLVKHRRPADPSIADPLTAHRLYGPPYIHPDSSMFVVPVQPAWHDALFPDFDTGLDLWTGTHAYGNALRKAYVSGTRSRRATTGDALLFYRSDDLRAATVVGVVEDVRVSNDPEVIRRFVGRRTVYTPLDLVGMSREHGELHAMMFRQDRMLDPPVSLKTLRLMGVLNGPPQSITEVRRGGRPWLHQQLAESQ
ncbi:MAG: GNAT family N-acetyltransferase [Cellulomonadaceae bacterium]|nr:GNAT family N-acetyltransferase [Cellulomonadaceae bacterium]